MLRHCARYRKPVANLVAAIAGGALERCAAPVFFDHFGRLAAHQSLQEPAVELGIDPAGLGRTDPVRDSAGTEKGDAFVRRPSLDASAHERPPRRSIA